MMGEERTTPRGYPWQGPPALTEQQMQETLAEARRYMGEGPQRLLAHAAATTLDPGHHVAIGLHLMALQSAQLADLLGALERGNHR